MIRNSLNGRPASRRILCAGAIAVTALLGLAGCSSDDDSSTTTSVATETTVDNASEGARVATARFDKEIQQELTDVGCHPGVVDGKLGPNTDAAIIRFQEAAGITADGELGPNTDAALKKALADGSTVCSDSTTTTTPGSTTTTTTTTTQTRGQAPCTATALLKGLPAEGETIGNYLCVDGYAAGSLTDGTKFLLQSENGQWNAPSQDPCGSASAGIDPRILEDGCPT